MIWYFVFAASLQTTLVVDDTGLQSLRRSRNQRTLENDAGPTIDIDNKGREQRLEDAMGRHIEELKRYKADTEAIEREYQEEIKAQLQDELT